MNNFIGFFSLLIKTFFLFDLLTAEFLDKKQKLDRIIQKNRGNPTEENLNNIRSKINTIANMNEETIDDKPINENYSKIINQNSFLYFI